MHDIGKGRPRHQRRDLIFAAVVVSISVVLSSLSIPSKMVVTRAIRGSVLAPFISLHQTWQERAGLRERLARLQTERNELSLSVITQAALAAENERLRSTLGVPAAIPDTFLVVELVPGRPIIGDSHSFLVRSGRDSGLEAPVGVGTWKGLVGVIRSLEANSGYGDFWTHPDFRVGAVVEGTDATGIVRAQHMETGEFMMLLEGVPFQSAVADGSDVVTSGEGGIYPAGLRIGTVAAPAETATKSGWSRSYIVEPGVRPGQTTVVLAWVRNDG
ncbi:MAG: rod shape-determining protein MreC [Gemmatimonadota bacterium]